MRIVADLHIHSPYSRATSPKLTPPYLERWAQIKGLDVLGTGDCTHPAWLKDLREQLDDAEEGMYTLRGAVREGFTAGAAQAEGLPAPEGAEKTPRFVLTGEISTIYKKDGKTRKVHHLVVLPDFKSAGAFQLKLDRIGNITSDGRPILGIDSRDLLAILLDTDERGVLIPAHIWTPWFSALGAKSGFDAIDECYGDLAPHITAIETGLSSNPPMNWALSSLDRFAVISNSDAHSPEKLGREATVFDIPGNLSLAALRDALRLAGGQGHIAETIEFFPQEGKYHYDGHRKCGIYLSPEDALTARGVCPVCGKPLTHGVMSRVLELADRPVDETAPYTPDSAETETNRRPYCSLIPLKELLGELLETGSASKKVEAAYNTLMRTANELTLLRDTPLRDLESLGCPGVSGELLAQGVARMRAGAVSITPGYDGEYGIIRAFPPREMAAQLSGSLHLEESREIEEKKKKTPREPRKKPEKLEKQEKKEKNEKTPEQEQAIHYEGRRALIIAGPGSGKTATLAARIAYLIERGTDAGRILAVSFTVKAAVELRERIIKAAGEPAVGVTAATFHSFCAAVLREEAGGEAFSIVGEDERTALLKRITPKHRGLGQYIEARQRFLLRPGETVPCAFAGLAAELCAADADASDAGVSGSAAGAGAGDVGAGAGVSGGGGVSADAELDGLYARYREALYEAGLRDFGDLVAETVRLFAEKPETLARYRGRYRAVFVDEYQDVNFAQYALIRLLSPNTIEETGGGTADGLKLWVIGDPNQAIYGFRGADKRFIDRFLEDYPDAETFRLTRSFRCGEGIIGAAGRLVNVSLRGRAGAVRLFRAEYPTAEAEAEGVARRIVRLIGGTSFFAIDRGGTAGAEAEPELTGLGECGILLRTLRLAPAFTAALKAYGIPFRLTGEGLWREEEPVASLLKSLKETPMTAESPQAAVSAARQRLTVPKYSPEQERRARDALDRLAHIAALYPTMTDFLDTLAVGDAEGGVEPEPQGVRVMTIHASKGLEFEQVFVPALEEGLLPFTLYGDGAAPRLGEEKRLLYVAMTRAKTGLYLSYSKKRVFQGRLLEYGRSRFLDGLENFFPLHRIENLFSPHNIQPLLF